MKGNKLPRKKRGSFVDALCPPLISTHLLVTLALFCSGCGKHSSPANGKRTLVCLVGGTMRPVIAELAEEYARKTGVEVEMNSGGSGELLANIEFSKTGDLYVCHSPFADILMRKGLGGKVWRVAELYPVIVVRKGNPKRITGLAGLKRKDVVLALTDYKLSTLGRMLPTIFGKAGVNFEKLNELKRVTTNKSGGYIANLVKMGNADAALVWNAVAYLRRDALDVVPIDDYLPTPNVDCVTSATGKNYTLTPVNVSVAILECSKNKEEAMKFAEFLASPRSRRIFQKYGYKTRAETRRK